MSRDGVTPKRSLRRLLRLSLQCSQLRRKRLHLLIGLGDSNSGLQSSHHGQKVRTTIGHQRMKIPGIIVRRDGCPETILRLIHGKAESRRHHTDNGIELSAETEGAPEDGSGGGELRQPQGMADEEHTGALGNIKWEVGSSN
jgi:hypothetical protein